jgi:hypothetical protein
VTEIIFEMPSSSAASISLRPRFSHRKSIFCREYTSRLGCSLSTVFSPSRVKSLIHCGTSPLERTAMTPRTSGPSDFAILGVVEVHPFQATNPGNRLHATQPTPAIRMAAPPASTLRRRRPCSIHKDRARMASPSPSRGRTTA